MLCGLVGLEPSLAQVGLELPRGLELASNGLAVLRLDIGLRAQGLGISNLGLEAQAQEA